MPDITITYDGRPVLTVALAARRYGLTSTAMRKALQRVEIEPLPEPLDGRTPLYDAHVLDWVMGHRPGRGANLRRTDIHQSADTDQGAEVSRSAP